MAYDELLTRAGDHARAFLRDLPSRQVNARIADPVFGTALSDRGAEPLHVLDAIARLVDESGVATPGPRYFGFVTGGAYPVAVAADWLVSAWDQNAALQVMSPAMARLEDVTAGWLLDLFGLPASSSVGFVTGATMANVTCLGAARHEVLRRDGWDVEADGLQRAPSLRVFAGAGAHASIDTAARLLGFGTSNLIRVAADAQGRMVPDALEAAMARHRSGDRLSAGRAREHRRVRSVRATHRHRASRAARGCTWTARSDCGREPPPRCGPSPTASSGPIRGASMHTSG